MNGQPSALTVVPASGSVPSPWEDRRVAVPGGSLYYRLQGSGSLLLLIGGGASNADTLRPLADRLAGCYTVIAYDRRGYARSWLADPGEPASVALHADDARRVISDLGGEPASVFGTSFGALIALELAVRAPALIARLIVHEPPLPQLLQGEELAAFDVGIDISSGDAGAAVDAIAASVGVSRGNPPAGTERPEVRSGDIELFVRRDIAAVGEYRLGLGQLVPIAGRIDVTASKQGRGFYPYWCAQRLAERLNRPLTELPGNHAGMIHQPAEFADGLKALLRQ